MENELQFSKVELFTNCLYTGMMLKGDLYSEDGTILFPAGQPLTDEVLKTVQSKNIKKVFYNRPLLASETQKNPMMTQQVLEKAFAVSEDIGYAAIKKTPLPEKEIEETVEQFITMVAKAEKGALLNLIEIMDYDEQTYVHSVNVAMIAVLFGKLLDWRREQTKMIGIAALLHDIGKILVPKEILNKKDPLTAEEFDIIKKHPIYGYNILKSQSKFPEPILKVALMHHECYDGQGYPLGVPNEKIDYMAQIVSICDFYEAITTNKIYRQKFAFWKAFMMIRKNMVSKFNPRFAIKFINKMPPYLVDKALFSIGDYVQLNTNETAEIVQLSNVETLKPSVKIYTTPNGEPLKYPLQINLEKEEKRWIETIIDDQKAIEQLKEMKA
jgi:putative nucleotidyltransferase with HDIG domain